MGKASCMRVATVKRTLAACEYARSLASARGAASASTFRPKRRSLCAGAALVVFAALLGVAPNAWAQARVPAAPSAPTLTAASAQLGVSWTAPANNGSAITDYDVQYREAGTTPWIHRPIVRYQPASANNRPSDATAGQALDLGTITLAGIAVEKVTAGGVSNVYKLGSAVGTLRISLTATNGTNGMTRTYVARYASTAPTSANLSSHGNQLWTQANVAYGSRVIQDAWTPALPANSHFWVTTTAAATSDGVRPIIEADDIRTSDTSLTLTGLTNGKSYEVQVRAANAVGEGAWSSSATLSAGAPASPSAPELASGNAQLTATWAAPADNGSSITGYTVQYCSSSCAADASWSSANVTVTVSTRTATITGLTNGTAYQVRVRASNAHGDGAWSSSATLSAGAPATPSAPELASGNAQLTATWAAPAGNGSSITGYDVQFCSSGCAADANWSSANVTVTVSTRTATITGLTNGTAYQVRVRASNARGDGAWSPVASETPGKPSAPSTPSLVVGVGQVKVSWSAATANGPTVSDYDVSYRLTGTTSWTDWPHTGTERAITITDLAGPNTYEVRVRASSAAGAGPWSAVASAQVTSAVPAKPDAPRLTSGVSSLSVTWSAPANNGSAISDYDVRHCSSSCDDDDNWTEWNASDTSTNTSATITGLTDGTRYEVQVRAENGIGSSSWSPAARLAAGAPGDPLAPTVSPGASQLKLDWTPPADNGSAIIDYDVRHCAGSCHLDASWTEWNESNTSTSTSATITGLTNGTSYEVQVRAANMRGDGAWSPSQTAAPGNPPSAPSAPTLTAASRKLDVSWTAPADNGSAITDYDVRYSQTGTGAWTHTPVVRYSPGNLGNTRRSDETTGGALDLGTIALSGIDVEKVTAGGVSNVYKLGSAVGTLRISLTATNGTQSTPGDPNTGVARTYVARYALTAPTSANMSSHGTQLWTQTNVAYGSQVNQDEWTPALPANSHFWVTTTAAATSHLVTPIIEADDISSSGTSLTLSELTDGTSYYVQVRAANAVGEGAWSPSATLRAGTPGVPDDVWVLPKNGSLEVSWWTPETDGGSAVTDYDVRYRPAGTTAWTQTSDTTASTSRVQTISPLTNGTSYDVQARAENANGSGPWSASVSRDPGSPEVPQRPYLTAGNGQLGVSWSAPANHGSAITDYDVRYSSDSGATWTEWNASNTSTATSTTVTGLENGTPYLVEVRAANERGDGHWSYPSVRRTLIGPEFQYCKPGGTTTLIYGGTCKIDADRDDIDTFDAVVVVSIPNVSGEPLLLENRKRKNHVDLIAFNPNGGTATVRTTLNGATRDTFTISMPAFGINSVTAVGNTTTGGPGSTFKLRVKMNYPANLPEVQQTYSGEPMRSWVQLGFPSGSGFGGTDHARSGYVSDPIQIVGRHRDTVEFTVRAGITPGPFMITVTAKTPYSGWKCAVSAPGEDCFTPISRTDTNLSYTVSSASLTAMVVAQAGVAAAPPQRVTPKLAAAAESVTATWSAPSSRAAEITRYEVQYRHHPDGAWTTWETLASDARTSTITGLQAGGTYQVRIRAENAFGWGAYSDPVAEATLPLSAPGVPGGLEVVRSAGAISVSWTSGEGASGYNVVFSSDDKRSWGRSHTNVAVTSVTISDVDDDAAYFVAVQAVNSVGSSGWVNSGRVGPLVSVPLSAPGVPGGLEVVRSAGAISISWASGEGASGYNVVFSSDGKRSWGRSHTNVAVTSVTISDVDDDAAYFVAVQAVNSVGSSGWVNSGRVGPLVSVPLSAPGVPGGLEVVRSAGAISISWASGEGASGYNVVFSSDGKRSWGRSHTNVAVTSVTISDVDDDAAYFVAVQAVNSVGSSGWVNSGRVGPLVSVPLSAPGVPGGLEVVRSAGAISVSWASGEGASGYNVVFSSDDKQSWGRSHSNVAVTSVTISDVDDDAAYFVAVQAVNSAGSSGWVNSSRIEPLTN